MNNRVSSPIIFVSMYKPPDSDINTFNIKLFKFFKSLLGNNNKKIIIAADMNIDLLKITNHTKTDQFLNHVLSFGMLPTITVPTRITDTTATLIDNIFTNYTRNEYISRVIYDDISDHLPILTIINCDVTIHHTDKDTAFATRNFNTVNYSNFIDTIKNTNWNSILEQNLLSQLTSHESYNIFFQKFSAIFNKSFPKNTSLRENSLNQKKILQPWMTPSLIKACRKKSKLLKNYKKSKTNISKIIYIKYKNTLKQAIKHEEKLYYEKQFSAKASDIRATWKLINLLMNRNLKDIVNDYFDINKERVTDKKKIANTFNTYFTNIGINLAKQIPEGETAVSLICHHHCQTHFYYYLRTIQK